MCLRIWEFYRNNGIHFSKSGKLVVLPLKPYEKMHVWQTSLLKFNGVNPSHCRAKHLLFDNQVNEENLLLMKDTKSGLSVGVCPGRRALRISGHLGLVVMVMKRSVRPYLLEIAREFWRFSIISLGPPWKVEGKIYLLPRLLALLAVSLSTLVKASTT